MNVGGFLISQVGQHQSGDGIKDPSTCLPAGCVGWAWRGHYPPDSRSIDARDKAFLYQVDLSGKILKILLLFPSPRLIRKLLPDGEFQIVFQFLHSPRNFMTLVSYPRGETCFQRSLKIMAGVECLLIPPPAPRIQLGVNVSF